MIGWMAAAGPKGREREGSWPGLLDSWRTDERRIFKIPASVKRCFGKETQRE